MRTQNGTTTVKELAVLAGSCGLVEKSEHGRQAFAAWFANDPKAARKGPISPTRVQSPASLVSSADTSFHIRRT